MRALAIPSPVAAPDNAYFTPSELEEILAFEKKLMELFPPETKERVEAWERERLNATAPVPEGVSEPAWRTDENEMIPTYSTTRMEIESDLGRAPLSEMRGTMESGGEDSMDVQEPSQDHGSGDFDDVEARQVADEMPDVIASSTWWQANYEPDVCDLDWDVFEFHSTFVGYSETEMAMDLP